jgi:excisionase family DNA binding protein
MNNSDRLMTKAEAADYLRVSTRYVERLAATGRLRVYKPTTRLFRVRQSEVDAFLETGASTK